MSFFEQPNGTACKYCGTDKTIKYGSYNGSPLYFCKLCNRKFKNNDHVFHMSTPAYILDKILNQYYDGTRVNDIRANIKIEHDLYPPPALIRYWIEKFTAKANDFVELNIPTVGDIWIADEMRIKLSNEWVWLYDIVDNMTEFIMTSCIVKKRTVDILDNLISYASIITGRMPEKIYANIPYNSYKRMRRKRTYVSEHLPKDIFSLRNRIGILSTVNMHRIRNLYYFRNIETTNQFINGLSIHYNYFLPNNNLNYCTPAKAAQINFPFNSWMDLIMS